MFRMASGWCVLYAIVERRVVWGGEETERFFSCINERTQKPATKLFSHEQKAQIDFSVYSF